jgi:CRISPR/Cas system CSM-associated protein Csm4 (group 5 of RAMP superfamily)
MGTGSKGLRIGHGPMVVFGMKFRVKLKICREFLHQFYNFNLLKKEFSTIKLMPDTALGYKDT